MRPSPTAKFYGDCKIGNCLIGDYCIIGQPTARTLLRQLIEPSFKLLQTQIGERCIIEPHGVIYEGAILHEEVFCGTHVRIGENTIIREGSKIEAGSQVFANVSIGKGCRIHGFICNDVQIGDYSTVYGHCVHKYHNHGGNPNEKSPRIGNDVIVGFESVIIGDIFIGDQSYIAAGAIVSKNVPERSFVYGTNKIISFDRVRDKWKLIFFDAMNRRQYTSWINKLKQNA